MSYQEDRFIEIADAIRQKDSTTAPIKATDFATRILAIESGGGGNDKALIERTITEYIDTNNMSIVGTGAFYSCRLLSQVSFPSCRSIGSSAFHYCSSLSQVSFPVCSSIGYGAFQGCSLLSQVSFPSCRSISNSVFRSCFSLSQVFLASSSIVNLGISVFVSTPMVSAAYLGYYGSIYVPASLVSSYKKATNWVAYSNRITSI